MTDINTTKNFNLYIAQNQSDYALLDSGDGMKLERYGDVVLSRPDPQALWKKRLPESDWASADASYVRSAKDTDRGNWVYARGGIEEGWSIKYDGLHLKVKPTPFKHTGLFQEQISNWQWAREKIEGKLSSGDKAKVKVLNLFGYTGGATISALQAGAEVTHVDASKSSIAWAKENAELSGLSDKPVRWILDDAFAFVKREVRRGNKYDAIIMDPPAFGRGAKGEIWRIEESFTEFFDEVSRLLSDKPLFVILNGYSAGYSAITYANNMLSLQAKFGGGVEFGELVISEEVKKGFESRMLPCGIVSRWSSNG